MSNVQQLTPKRSTLDTFDALTLKLTHCEAVCCVLAGDERLDDFHKATADLLSVQLQEATKMLHQLWDESKSRGAES